jgi:hypothetical protein
VNISAGTSSTTGIVKRMRFDECEISGNQNNGITCTPYTASASVEHAEDRRVTDVWFRDCKINDNGGAASSVQSIGLVFLRCEVKGNTTNGAITGTGGLATAGAIGAIIQDCFISGNLSGGLGFDGVGIHLDQRLNSDADASYTPTTHSIARGNYISNHLAFRDSNPLDTGSSGSCGIKVYKARNCKIYNNVCEGNAVGIADDANGDGHVIANNALINNLDAGFTQVTGIKSSADVGNLYKNNIVVGSSIGAVSSTLVNAPDAGNLTLSAVSGNIVTATSTAADFVTLSTNTIIHEPSSGGYGYVFKKVSDTQVKMRVERPFSGTTINAPNWEHTLGARDPFVGNDNNYFNCPTVYNGPSGVGDITTDPLLVGSFGTQAGSPCRNNGANPIKRFDYNNTKNLSSTICDIGAVQSSSETFIASSRKGPARRL